MQPAERGEEESGNQNRPTTMQPAERVRRSRAIRTAGDEEERRNK
jgi:hypothetical protein